MGSAGRLLLASTSLWWREQVRFLRQRSRLIGALLTPFLFWVLLGSGIGSSFRGASPLSGEGYLEYFFPGALVMLVLFTAIFSTISVIEDRNEGFLQAVLVAPVPRVAVVLGKVAGGTTLALLQGVLFLAAAPLAGVPLGLVEVLVAGVLLALVAFWLTALGFFLAWLVDSVQGFHVIMNLVLLPMWLLSGAVFPASGAAGWMRIVMWANPLTYGMAAVRRALMGAMGSEAGEPGLPGFWLSVGVTVALCVVCLWAATRLARRTERNVT
jgi:ABC-2 type transport system permease protein